MKTWEKVRIGYIGLMFLMMGLIGIEPINQFCLEHERLTLLVMALFVPAFFTVVIGIGAVAFVIVILILDIPISICMGEKPKIFSFND